MSDIITCPKCGAVIGKIVIISGVDMLQVGAVIAKHVTGFCAQCGGEYYYNTDIRQLAKIMNKLDTLGKT